MNAPPLFIRLLDRLLRWNTGLSYDDKNISLVTLEIAMPRELDSRRQLSCTLYAYNRLQSMTMGWLFNEVKDFLQCDIRHFYLIDGTGSQHHIDRFHWGVGRDSSIDWLLRERGLRFSLKIPDGRRLLYRDKEEEEEEQERESSRLVPVIVDDPTTFVPPAVFWERPANEAFVSIRNLLVDNVPWLMENLDEQVRTVQARPMAVGDDDEPDRIPPHSICWSREECVRAMYGQL